MFEFGLDAQKITLTCLKKKIIIQIDNKETRYP